MLQLVERVIAEANAKRPADRLLRQALSEAKFHFVEDRNQASDALFAYYRWLGWLEEEESPKHRILRARDLDQRNRQHEGGFDAKSLAERAIPAWIHGFMEVETPWLRQLQRPPVLWIRARAEKEEGVMAEMTGLTPHPALAHAFRHDDKEDLFKTLSFKNGAFEIQDIASQAVAAVCAPKSGETWWDMCAGEGGKTLHLGDLMGKKGLIWATDTVEWRLEKLKKRAARASLFNYRSKHWVDTTKPPVKALFDGILVDAPCTGVGTWHRNPHARWTLTATDILELAARQKQLLRMAAAQLKPGGRLLYSVCTMTHAETIEVARWADSELKELERAPFANPLSPKGGKSPTLQIKPHEVEGNGMFVAMWTKKAQSPPSK